MIEFIFTLTKLKKNVEQNDKIDFFKEFIKIDFNKVDVLNAYNKCQKLDKCRNINDFIHLEIANKHCKKLVTFDSDFKKLQKFYDVEIEILGE